MALDPRRTGRITGSRVAAILGLSPFGNLASVMRDMVRQYAGLESTFTGNVATEHGTRHEPDALAAYERITGNFSYGGDELIIHPEYDWLCVTPDGLIDDDGMVEAKAPYRGIYRHHSERPDYCAQMQLQMACAGRDWCDFVIWYSDDDVPISRLDYDPEWLPSVLPELESFMSEYHAIINDPERLADYTSDRTYDEWREAAQTWKHCKAMIDDYTAIQNEARSKLEALAPDGAKGCGITLSKVERAGSIPYSKVIKELMPDADLEQYRGEPTSYYAVRADK